MFETTRYQPTVLYLVYDEAGVLVYVGITNLLYVDMRLAKHANHAPWWPAAARVEGQLFSTRAEALAAETALIRKELPDGNQCIVARTERWSRGLIEWPSGQPRPYPCCTV